MGAGHAEPNVFGFMAAAVHLQWLRSDGGAPVQPDKATATLHRFAPSSRRIPPQKFFFLMDSGRRFGSLRRSIVFPTIRIQMFSASVTTF